MMGKMTAGRPGAVEVNESHILICKLRQRDGDIDAGLCELLKTESPSVASGFLSEGHVS